MRTHKDIGREILAEEKKGNRAAAGNFRVGEAVQYYKDGWRYGHVVKIGERGRFAGMIQIEHQVTGNIWVKASDVRALPPLKACASARKRRRGAPKHRLVPRSSC